MDLDEIKALLAKLSKPELDKLLKNLKRVSFDFKINKSFFKYSSHPITIPREFYPFLDIHGITKKHEATITFPNSSTATAYIHYSKAGWGENYQIRIRNYYSDMGLADLKFGDIVKVELFKDSEKTRIELSPSK